MMLAAEVENPYATLLAGLFVVFILLGLAQINYFERIVVPKVVPHWAVDQGFKIIQDESVGVFSRMAVAASTSQVVRRIIVQDDQGKTHSGLLKIGSYWWPDFSDAGCPVEVKWDNPGRPVDWSE